MELVDLKSTPIATFNAGAILTQDGKERSHTTVILATEYDNMTGSLTTMSLRGKDGIDLKEKWKNGVWTHLGLMASTCPNMFMIYGPQGW